MGGHVARMAVMKNAYKILVGKPQRKMIISRPRRRWKDDIKMSLRPIACKNMHWIQLAKDRVQRRTLVNTIIKFRVLQELEGIY
jgi:hypothetical protein